MFLVIILELVMQQAACFKSDSHSLSASVITAPSDSISAIFPSTIEPVGIGFIEYPSRLYSFSFLESDTILTELELISIPKIGCFFPSKKLKLERFSSFSLRY